MWIARDNDQEFGPFTDPQLKAAAAKGQFSRKAMVRREEDQHWRPLFKNQPPAPNPSGGGNGWIVALIVAILLAGMIIAGAIVGRKNEPASEAAKPPAVTPPASIPREAFGVRASPPSSAPTAPQNPPPPPPVVKVEEPPISILATGLINAYEANEVAADHRFKGRTLIVRGVVGQIGKVFDQAFVTLNGGEAFAMREVQCIVKNERDLLPLKKGQMLTVRGRCDGMSMNIVLVDCTLP